MQDVFHPQHPPPRKRLQRNFGIPEETAVWLRVAAFQLNKSQSQLAREAFDLLAEHHPEVQVPDDLRQAFAGPPGAATDQGEAPTGDGLDDEDGG